MASSELSLDSSSNSAATETESDQDDPYQTKPKEVHINKPLAEEASNLQRRHENGAKT